jgi:diguanylate cyclase (GGDEF)-like protein
MYRRSDPIPNMPAGPSVGTLRRRFMSALALVAVFAAGQYVTVRGLLRAESARATLFQRAGQERLRVQRAAVITHELFTASGAVRDSLRGALGGIADTLDVWHREYVHADELSPERDQLDRGLELYVEALREVAAVPAGALTPTAHPARTVLAAAAAGTSSTLDQLVTRLAGESSDAIAHTQRVAMVMLVGMLLVLLLIGVGMFRPALRQLEREHRLRTVAWEQLTAMSTHDALTGIPNRRAFDFRFDEEFRRAQREGRSVALLMADIDHFKPYNDAYGHPRGDLCLRRIADELENAVARPADFVARYGGEEFAVVLPETNEAGALRVAEALRTVVEKMGQPNWRADGPVTISLGVAALTPRAGDEPEDLIGAADRALYRAKQSGRNRVEVASEVSGRSAGARLPTG